MDKVLTEHQALRGWCTGITTRWLYFLAYNRQSISMLVGIDRW